MRLLILTVSAGVGHIKASQAIYYVAKKDFSDIHCQSYDVVDLTPKTFKVSVADSYHFLANKAPNLWGLLFNISDGAPPIFTKGLFRLQSDMLYSRFFDFVRKFNPDFVLCTHFVPMHMLINKFGWRKNRFPIGVVITDYYSHSMWINKRCDFFAVASEEVKEYLSSRYNISPNKIYVTGIPVSPIFIQRQNKNELLEKFALSKDLKTILLLCGGYGNINMAKAVEKLLIYKNFQIICIAGASKLLFQKFKEIAERSNGRVKSYGFVNNMHEFMDVADIVVTKPGGLSIAECLVKGLPMVLLSVVPGQEEKNCDYLLEQGAAIKANNIHILDFKIRMLLEDEKKLINMKENAQRLARPNAAYDILKAIYKK